MVVYKNIFILSLVINTKIIISINHLTNQILFQVSIKYFFKVSSLLMLTKRKKRTKKFLTSNIFISNFIDMTEFSKILSCIKCRGACHAQFCIVLNLIILLLQAVFNWAKVA